MRKLEELKLEKQIAPLPTVVMGGVLVIPSGLLADLTGKEASKMPVPPRDKQGATHA